MRRKPLAIDLFCGLGGWTEGLLAEGYDVIGFDIERHVYGDHKYPAQLVIQDVRTLHGSQFRDAALIVASPPCQAYSYRAMPWKRAKALPPPDNTLFNECFRIQREACEAAGRHIPLVVENVRGAQPWVGRARWNFGSFYLWGDVPALMPPVAARKVVGFRFDGSGKSFQSASVEQTGMKNPGLNWSAHADPDYRSSSKGGCFRDNPDEHIKQGGSGAAWFDKLLDERRKNPEGFKLKDSDGYERDHPNAFGWKNPRHGLTKRKMASAMIAKIPLPLSRHIARTYA